MDKEIEKELSRLSDEKLDKAPMEKIDTSDLSVIDLSLETEAVTEAVRVILEIANKLKGI